ncbi:hypothetical protein C8Q80DRAFT_212557 [Daedaleopsis nitida]|nr:hypothetical protein C8Q80DRAFT_212557 [Daedaleopsis nitida]
MCITVGARPGVDTRRYGIWRGQIQLCAWETHVRQPAVTVRSDRTGHAQRRERLRSGGQSRRTQAEQARTRAERLGGESDGREQSQVQSDIGVCAMTSPLDRCPGASSDSSTGIALLPDFLLCVLELRTTLAYTLYHRLLAPPSVLLLNLSTVVAVSAVCRHYRHVPSVLVHHSPPLERHFRRPQRCPLLLTHHRPRIEVLRTRCIQVTHVAALVPSPPSSMS